MTYWVDVEDLFQYRVLNSRPSGIQRLSFELCRALVALRPTDIAFCRHDPCQPGVLRRIDWAAVRRLYEGLSADPAAAPIQQADRMAPLPMGVGDKVLGGLAGRLDPCLRLPLGEALRGQVGVLRALRRAMGGLGELLRRKPGAAGGLAGGLGRDPGEDLARLVRPGDTLLVLGAPWFHRDYAGQIAPLRAATGLRLAVLIHDLIPVVRPEYCRPALIPAFTNCYRALLPLADQLFANARATAREAEACAPRLGITLRGPVVPLPVGSGFSGAPAAAGPLPAGLRPGGYALIVSTLEARKNHLLLFHVWRRLLRELPVDQVPQLVFAGRPGWLVGDLLQQIESCGRLGGKLVLVDNPTDATLAALYRGCRFTLFPSFYEGWGLPVTESLAFGKVCIASSAASVPEAGGDLCLYHDPEDVLGATAMIRLAIHNPGEIAALERRIAAEFRPVPWEATARAMLDRLEPGAARPETPPQPVAASRLRQSANT